MKFDTKMDAVHAWVSTFNAIPMSVIEKLEAANMDDLVEVTPPAVYDSVYIYDGEYTDEEGEIVAVLDDDTYTVRLNDGEEIELESDQFEVLRQYRFPIWGTMWAFDDEIDNDWLEGEFGQNGLQLMANCGFRIFESEDYGYVFGIDGAGFDFFSERWLPLYDARGLHWHKEEKEAA